MGNWKDSILITIFKKADRRQPGNYGGISLMNSTIKLFTSILKDKMEETKMAEKQ